MYELYVGTYTQPILFGTGELLNAQGRGVYRLMLDNGGVLSPPQLMIETQNPSYLAFSPDRRTLYAVNELKEWNGGFGGAVSAFAVGPRGELSLLAQRSTGGADPCHVAVSGSGRWVFAANFMSGSLAAFSVDGRGAPGGRTGFFQHEGRGPDPLRQAGPHAHFVLLDEEAGLISVPDLGLDKLMHYTFDTETAHIMPAPVPFTPLPAGCGPRCGVYGADRENCYLVGELSSQIIRLSRGDGGALAVGEAYSTVADSFTDSNICAHVHLAPDGEFLYASNRGEDTLVCFTVDPHTGHLTLRGRYPCGGRTPRHFTVTPDGRFLVVANQDSNRVCAFHIQAHTGVLTVASAVSVPTPVCVQIRDRGKQI